MLSQQFVSIMQKVKKVLLKRLGGKLSAAVFVFEMDFASVRLKSLLGEKRILKISDPF
jgi:hypothetical protein